MNQMEEMKARLAAATPGPWMKDPDEPTHILKPDKPGSSWDGTVIATLQRDDFGLFEEANADLIAHAPETQAKLIAALEAVEALHARHLGNWTDPSGIPWTGDHCAECRDEWPCPTATAIKEALA